MRSVIFLLALCLSSTVSAQNMFVGPELGLNLIQVEEQEIGNDYQPGLYAGLAYDYQFNDLISIRTGLYCSQSRHGFSTEDTSAFDLFGIPDSAFAIPGVDMNTYISTEGRRSHYYLQLPIQANVSWKNIQFFAGGYVGFMIAGKQKTRVVERTPFMTVIDIESIDSTGFLTAFLPPAYRETQLVDSETDDFHRFDYGLRAGIGYQLDNFGVQATYSFGLPDYRKGATGQDLHANRHFQFSVRYMLPLTKASSSSSSID